jgi:phosphomevalonate kinase
VAAVDRRVLADADRPADLVTAEVREAIAAGAIASAPWFDASALRVTGPDGASRKLGLGSSAAILAASLATASPEDTPRALLFERALAAHRAAQGGGSGVDVAASVFGGVLECRLDPASGRLDVRPHALPAGAVVEVFSSPTSAETRSLLALVRAFAAASPDLYRSLLDRAAAGARAAIAASTPADLARAIAAQGSALGEIGERSSAPIVTPETARVAEAAASEGAAFGPSGAGGGDVSIFVGGAPSSAALRALASEAGFTLLDVGLGAPGVSRCD